MSKSMYEVKGASLLFQDKKITFQYKIEKVLRYGLNFLVLLEVPSKEIDNRNVFLVDSHMQIIWQIEAFPIDAKAARSYTSIGVKDENIYVYNRIGYDCVVDSETGKIKNIEFVK